MATIRYNILQVIEDVMASFIAAQGIPELGGTNQDTSPALPHVYRGIEDRDPWQNEGEDSSITKMPCVIVACQEATPTIPVRPGNWDATAAVEVWSSSDDFTNEQHGALVEEVMQSLITNSLISDLQSVDPQFYAEQYTLGPLSYKISSRMWVTEFKIVFHQASGNGIQLN